MRRKIWALLAAVAMVTTLFATAAGANPWEFEDLVGQQLDPDGPDTFVDAAKIRRTDKGVTASVSMPTPDLDPDTEETYVIPDGGFASGDDGAPAAFSLWVFIFFNPEACLGPCDHPSDLLQPGLVGAGYNAGGHLVSGPNLTISGQVNAQSRAFGPGTTPVCTEEQVGAAICVETIGQALALDDADITIGGAEIHVAVAPHGKLDASLMPEQISTPAGGPGHWWVALYK